MYDEEQLGQDIIADTRGVGTIALQVAARVVAWLIRQIQRNLIVGSKNLLNTAHRRHVEHILDGRMSSKMMRRLSIEKDWPTKTAHSLTQEQYTAFAARLERDRMAFSLQKEGGKIIGLDYFARDFDKVSHDLDSTTRMNSKQADNDLNNTVEQMDEKDRQTIFYHPARLDQAIKATVGDPGRLDRILRSSSLKLETIASIGRNTDGGIRHVGGEKLTDLVVTHANNDAQPLTPRERQTADRIFESLSLSLSQTSTRAAGNDNPKKAQRPTRSEEPRMVRADDSTQQLPIQHAGRRKSLEDVRSAIANNARKIARPHAHKPKTPTVHHVNSLK